MDDLPLPLIVLFLEEFSRHFARLSRSRQLRNFIAVDLINLETPGKLRYVTHHFSYHPCQFQVYVTNSFTAGIFLSFKNIFLKSFTEQEVV